MAESRQLNFDFGNEASIPYILISLKEQWHQKILSGDKRFEYRRQFIRTSAHVFIYVSGFVRGICAYAEFGAPTIGSVDKIISIYKSEGMRNTEGLFNYFRNRNECFAIPIKEYQEIPKISLDELRQKFNSFTVPHRTYILIKSLDC